MPVIDRLPAQKAHVGVIVPAVNRVCEQQFHAYAPHTLGIHTMRARIAGKWSRSIEDLAPEIRHVTGYVAECHPDLIVYNCTASSMKEGPAGERRILEIMREASDIDAVSTSAMVSEAFAALGVKSVVVISPYPNNDDIVAYLTATNMQVASDVALKLPVSEYSEVTPDKWLEIACSHNVQYADAIFLSCAATTQIEAVAAIEKELGKPVVNSNQAVLWGVLKRLKPKLGTIDPKPHLGSLMQTL